MLDLRAKHQAVTIRVHANKVQTSTCKPASRGIEKTTGFFQYKPYTVQHALALKAVHGVLAKPTIVFKRGIDEVISFKNLHQNVKTSFLKVRFLHPKWYVL